MNIIEKIPTFWKQKLVLCTAIVCTMIWMISFPVFLYCTMVIMSLVLDVITKWIWIRNIIIFLAFLLPLSSIATIVSIWLCYFYKKISIMYLSNLIPIMTVIGLYAVISSLYSLALIYN